jgi:hypothetical protein
MGNEHAGDSFGSGVSGEVAVEPEDASGGIEEAVEFAIGFGGAVFGRDAVEAELGEAVPDMTRRSEFG